MAAVSVGEADIRGETISRIVTGFALQEYRMKQLCMVQSSKAWTETYFKETAADLTAGGGNITVEGVPRLANFPYGEVTWTKVQGRNIKHAMEGVLSWEDVKTNAIDVIARTLLRIARAVASSVDGVIAAQIKAQAGATITPGGAWDDAVIADRDPIQDILDAKAAISIANYNPDNNGFLVVNPDDFSHLLGNANIRNAGQFYTSDVTKNGKVGRILGLTLISTNSVLVNSAQVVVGKEACTWKSVVGLTVKTIVDPGIKYTIRAWEVGQIQVTNPDAIADITPI